MKYNKTPINYLEKVLDNKIFIKRDDLLPFSFGGNKIRIAEEFFEDMKKGEYDCIVGYGNARSNLSRAIANLSQKYNIECYIISPSDEDGSRIETGNSRIVKACGAKFVTCDKHSVSVCVKNVLSECRKKGKKPYYIYGNEFGEGNEATPLKAYVKVYEEIKEQEKQLGATFDYIFLATGTGMTQGGLLIGQAKAQDEKKIVGISIARKTEYETAVLKKMLVAYKDEIENVDLDKIEINVVDDYMCEGYGKYNDDMVMTSKHLLLKFGIPTDLTYTGKAYYEMKEFIKEQGIKNKNILFIHTGGTPLFFDNLEALKKVKRQTNNERK